MKITKSIIVMKKYTRVVNTCGRSSSFFFFVLMHAKKKNYTKKRYLFPFENYAFFVFLSSTCNNNRYRICGFIFFSFVIFMRRWQRPFLSLFLYTHFSLTSTKIKRTNPSGISLGIFIFCYRDFFFFCLIAT